MKDRFRKILPEPNRKNIIILTVILVVIAAFAAYILFGVYTNVQKMSASTEVTYFPKYPAVNANGKNAELIKRGEYLAKAGDCMACHTNTPLKEKSQPFAGGLPMQTPFGTIYSPNITPDKETGIGNWTEEQFIKAMREGLSPKGHYYFPAFPYLYFNKVTDDDLKAIKAYLDSIPAVHQNNRKNEMIFPFNFRFLQLGWRIIFFHPENKGAYVNDPKQSDLWNRGAYLTDGLGHCSMCHSPSYHIFTNTLSLGAPIREYDLTGAKIQGYLAPNISSSNLANVPDKEVIEVFTKDKLIGGGKVEGPMLEVNHDSLKYLSDYDLLAITTYLKSVRSKTPPAPTGGAIGKSIYENYCSGCHANGSGGAPKYGDKASWDPVVKEGLDKAYLNAIQGKGGMPAKGTCLTCSDDQIKQTVDYMLASTKEGTGVIVKMAKPKQYTLTDGKRIYQENCAVCHDNGFRGAPKPGNEEALKSSIDKGFLKTYQNVITGDEGHPARGACENCTDGEIKAAVKYLMQTGTTTKDFTLW